MVGVFAKAVTYSDDYNNYHMAPPLPLAPKVIAVWCHPWSMTWKLNVDASFNVNSTLRSRGDCVRDGVSDFLLGFCRSVPQPYSILAAELLAIRKQNQEKF